jgi:hypothetical protein
MIRAVSSVFAHRMPPVSPLSPGTGLYENV